MATFDTAIYQMLGTIILFLVVYLGVWMWAKGADGKTGPGFQIELGKNMDDFLKIILYLVTAVFFFILVFWMAGSTNEIMKSVGITEGFQSNDDTLIAQKSLYNELLGTLASNERYLINLQPLTAYYGGFLGPMDKGEFKPADYVRKAMQAGIRSFVLPISRYIDDNKKAPNWPPSGSPSISFRDAKGDITSVNGMSIRDFVRGLIMNMQENSSQASEPILLYLLADVKVPDAIDEEELYVTFMHDIAKDLKDLDSSRLISAGSRGSAVGGQAERAILMEIPVEDLKGKVLIATNFQTSLALKDKYKSMSPSLHQYSNFILQPMGGSGAQGGAPNIVQSSGNTSSANLLLKLSDVIGSKVPWGDQSRTIWHAAILNDPYKSPSAEHVEEATKKGIQSIAVPFFYTGEEDQKIAKTIWSNWKGFAWRVKEKDIRFAKPEPVTVKAADPRLSSVAAPGLMPGQMSVK